MRPRDAQRGDTLRPCARRARVLGLLLGGIAQLSAQSPTGVPVPAPASIVELPPMIVAETKGQPWLHVATANHEFLSRCSTRATREFVEGQLIIHQLLRELIPSEFLATMAIPNVSIVVPQSGVVGRDDAVFQEMMKEEEMAQRKSAVNARNQRSDEPASANLQFLPNMRLDDRDMVAGFTLINEATFENQRLTVATGYVRFLLARRAPTLPQWLIEGITGLYDQTELRGEPITFKPFNWVSREETTALLRDPESRRVLLPCADLFAPDALVGEDNRAPVRSAVWQAQTALLVRWALDPNNPGMSAALWKLADRAGREPMTEKLVTECFGFGYADLLDRLSDYLPTAVKDPVKLKMRKLPPVPRFEMKPATSAQIARLRGEWERMEISVVKEKHPQFLQRYADQARGTFARARARGEREPQLVAAAALCELEAGDLAAALPLLEEAVTAQVERPRVYYELARLRWMALARGAPERQLFSLDQLYPVLEPLRQGMRQLPLLPEMVLLNVDVWLRSRERISPSELGVLVSAAPWLRRYPTVGFQVALLQTTQGKRAEAGAMLGASIPFVTDPAIQAKYRELEEYLAKEKGQ
jgi:hypothetical protein